MTISLIHQVEVAVLAGSAAIAATAGAVIAASVLANAPTPWLMLCGLLLVVVGGLVGASWG